MYGAKMRSTARHPSNRQRLRAADDATKLGLKSLQILLTVLMQSGGSVTVTGQTIADTGKHLDRLRFEVAKVGDTEDYVVRIVDVEDPADREVELPLPLDGATDGK